MNLATIVWGLVLAIHLLCVVAWIGGMAFALLVLRPSLAMLEPPLRLSMHVATLRRFFLIVWHAMPLVLISGYAMVFGVYGGFANLDWSINVMQLLGLVMAIIYVVLFFGPWSQLRRAPDPAPLGRIRRLVTLNLVLGMVVIVVASLGHFG